MLNGYLAFYKRSKIEVYARDSYAAQIEAAKKLGVSKARQHHINVILCEKEGKQVVHSTAMF